MIENEVSAMDVAGQIELSKAFQSIFSKTQVHIMQNTERNTGILKVLEPTVSKNQVSAIDRKGRKDLQ